MWFEPLIAKYDGLAPQFFVLQGFDFWFFILQFFGYRFSFFGFCFYLFNFFVFLIKKKTPKKQNELFKRKKKEMKN